jgi:hypothetical protein
MARLVCTAGAVKGTGVELRPDTVVTIGRDVDNIIVLSDPNVSRRHAEVVWKENGWCVRDWGSLNGMFVNGILVEEEVVLKPGDRIRIGGDVFALCEDDADPPAAEDYPAAAKDDPDGADIGRCDESGSLVFWDPPPPVEEPTGELEAVAPGDIRFLKDGSPIWWSVSKECRRLWEHLQENHVWVAYPRERYRELCERIESRSSKVTQALSDGFYRVVVLDAARGLTDEAPRRFDIHRFVAYALEIVLFAFDLELPPDVCEPEDIAQILKDEPRSLFCFYNVQCVPARSLVRIRNFTQELHQVLLLALARDDQPLRPDTMEVPTEPRGRQQPGSHASPEPGTGL